MIEFKNLAELPDTHWKPPQTYDFLGAFPYVPVADTELLLSAHHFPIAISCGETGPEVVLVLDATFLRTRVTDARGRWQRSYVPLAIRTLPFRLDPGGAENPAIQASAALGLLGNQGHRLLEPDGSQSRELAAVRTLLETLRSGRERLRRAAERLILADLLCTIMPPGGRKTSPALLTVDGNQLERLSPNRAAALISDGVAEMDLAIACRFSQRHFGEAITWQPEQASDEAVPDPHFYIKGMDALPVVLDSSHLFSIHMLERG